MPSLTGILGILLAISLAALAGSGMLLKTAWQDVAEANQLYVAQQNETKKAIAEINAVRFEHMQQIHSMQNNLEEQGYDGIRQFDADGNVVQINVFDPKNIRSINADFNPMRMNEADLQAGIASLGTREGTA